MKISAGVKKVRFFIALFLLLFFSINYFVPIKEFNTDSYFQFELNDQKWILKKDLLGFYMAPINGFLFKKEGGGLLYYWGYLKGIKHGEWEWEPELSKVIWQVQKNRGMEVMERKEGPDVRSWLCRGSNKAMVW